LQIRKIRNIEIWRSDLLSLINGRQKIPSTPINAFGAQLQEYDQDRDYTIFSSWLGAFVSGEAKEGRAEGTFEEHTKAAVSASIISVKSANFVTQCPTDTLETLLASREWILPLCGGGSVLHWVLAWVDFGTSEIGMFDSVPELGSHSWAIPVRRQLNGLTLELIMSQVALKVFERIRETLGAPKIDFEKWRQKVFYPSALQRQMDGWACGLFLLMAMRARAKKTGFECVIDDAKEEMREVVLEALLKLP